MPSITGIELGPDSCVLARARSVAGATEVSALHAIEPSAWPTLDVAVAAALREARRRKGFPRRAVVVAWGVSEPAAPDAPHVRPLLRPLLSAGFKIGRVLTPPEALCALARTRPRTPGEAVAWLALNTYGAAIAIVRDGELLYSRSFDWTFSSNLAGPRAEMLQRYSLVTHLAPEVRRGISMARNAHGATVDVAVTCGNLPDLRSLTMPLIEELDLEVETLDSTEGLVSTGAARTDRFAETAPALRLAVAAAGSTAAAATRRRSVVGPLLRVAAAAAIVASAGWAAWRQFGGAPVKPAGAGLTAPAAQTKIASNLERRPVPPPAPVSTPPAPAQPAKDEKLTPPAPKPATAFEKPMETAAKPPAAKPPAQKPPAPKPVPVTPPAVETKAATPPPPPTTSRPMMSPPAPIVVERAPVSPLPAPAASPASSSPELLNAVVRPTPPARRPTPSKDPVPAVESILISRDRRVAIVDGAIVGVGDAVGSRVVVQIERNGIVLREASGYELHVSLRRGSGAQ